MRRVFICSDAPFPRASAGGNYIQYLAKALIEEKWEVIVITTGDNRKEDFNINTKTYSYSGIKYKNLQCNKNSKLVKEKFIEIMKEYRVTDEDYAILYGSNISMIKYLNNNFHKNHVCVCRVEMMQSFQYKLGIFNPKYIKYKSFYNYVYRNIKKTIPISTNIEKYERLKGCNTLLLPIMADPFEYIEEVEDRYTNKIKIIYSGAKKTNFEDDVQNMLVAFSKLDDEWLENIEFHLTGTTKDKLQEILGEDNRVYDLLKNSIIIHEWLEYDELIDLYKQMDYIFLARKNNVITQSNFPSKIPEALSFGIIPICSNVGDYTKYYLTDDFDSFIFNGSSIDSCLNTLKRAISISKEERYEMRKNCRNTAINKFYYKLWSKRISDFLIQGNQ